MYIGGLNERGLVGMLADMIDDELIIPGNRFSHVKVALLPDDFYQIEFIGDVFDIQPRHFVEFVTHGANSWGADLVVIAALSDPLDVEVIREGQRWRQRLVAGVPLEPATRDRIDLPSVLRLKYRPDPSLFKNLTLPSFRFIGRIQEFAIFHPNTIFEIDDRRAGWSSRRFHYPLGLRDYIHELEYDLIHLGEQSSPLHLEISEGPNRAQAVLLPTHFAEYVIRSYANHHRTPDGGTHVKAFESAFQRIASEFKDRDGYPFYCHDDRDSLHGLTVLLAVELADISYYGATKARLDGELPAKLVTQMINEQLPPLLKQKTAHSRR